MGPASLSPTHFHIASKQGSVWP